MRIITETLIIIVVIKEIIFYLPNILNNKIMFNNNSLKLIIKITKIYLCRNNSTKLITNTIIEYNKIYIQKND